MSIKSTIAAVAASPFLLAGAAFAGPYVNVESNLSYPDGEYSSASTDAHIGYEGETPTVVKLHTMYLVVLQLITAESTDDYRS